MNSIFKVRKILWSETWGTTHNYIEEVECPNCHLIFSRKISSGCLHTSYNPFTCPKCNYPWNKAIIDCTTLPKQDDEYNPSSR